MPLQQGIQVVLQHPRKNGGSTCRAFAGLPNVAPAWFCVEPLFAADSSAASDLGDELAAAIVALGPQVHEITPPCGGSNFGHCHAGSVPDCTKILLPVVGAVPGSSMLLQSWPSLGPLARICPVLTSSAGALPQSLRAINGVQWSPGDFSAIGRILQLGGMVSARPRLFISYARAETQALAEQLHDKFNQLGFEVFLDRFSVKPGVDFQVRLTEELSRMGTILVLESAGVLKSKWVRHEVQFARSYRLGLMALHLPKGALVHGISKNLRLPITATQLNGYGKLATKHLNEVALKLQMRHAEAERIRVAYLRDTMSDALLLHGFSSQRFDVGGIVVARKNANTYSFALRNLPPEVTDFHAVEGYRTRSRSSFVVAPAKYIDWQSRRSLTWLSNETGIGLEDEGEMIKLVQRLP